MAWLRGETHTFQTVHNFFEDFLFLAKACVQPVHFGFGSFQNIAVITNAMIGLGFSVFILVTGVSSRRCSRVIATIPH
jgi:hypothetical protein